MHTEINAHLFSVKGIGKKLGMKFYFPKSLFGFCLFILASIYVHVCVHICIHICIYITHIYIIFHLGKKKTKLYVFPHHHHRQ